MAPLYDIYNFNIVICSECGALVDDCDTQRHDDFHDSLQLKEAEEATD